MKTRSCAITIEEDRCKGCGLCVHYCPKKCLALSAKLNAFGDQPAGPVAADRCTGCGTCYVICPEYAITLELNADDK